MPDDNKHTLGADEVASYVEALKIHLEEKAIKDEEVKNVVRNMPSPRVIRKKLSEEEVDILFESVRWAWKKISGQDLIEESKVTHPVETLMGNYWMLKNGVILHGENHFTIVKRNISMFSSLLGIHAFAIHDCIAGPPERLIKLVIDHGGIRMFITKDRRAYFQMNDAVYAKWGRNKVKGLDFKEKVVNLIDKRTKFKDWSSGISIRLP